MVNKDNDIEAKEEGDETGSKSGPRKGKADKPARMSNVGWVGAFDNALVKGAGWGLQMFMPRHVVRGLRVAGLRAD